MRNRWTGRLFSAQEVREGVECKKCGATVGELCWDDNGVQMPGCHWQRHNDFERKRGRRGRRGARGMTVRYVCPICGGPHARADHA
jgi:DNA-directed RNA polymerase subunit RPC12/RpoP